MKRRSFIRSVAIGTAAVPLASFEWLATNTTSLQMAGFHGHVRHGLFNATVAHSGMKPIAAKWLYAISRNCFFKNGLDATSGEVLHHSLMLGDANHKFLASCYSTQNGFQLELGEQLVESADAKELILEQDGYRWQMIKLTQLEKRDFTLPEDSILVLVSGSAEVSRQEMTTSDAYHVSGAFSILSTEDSAVLMASRI